MRSRGKNVSTDVFLNIPYDNNPLSESLLVAYTASLVALGRKPRLTFEIPDGGTGRMGRIFSLLKSCPISFHDLRPFRIVIGTISSGGSVCGSQDGA